MLLLEVCSDIAFFIYEFVTFVITGIKVMGRKSLIKVDLDFGIDIILIGMSWL